jgi:hypothetical protein
MDTYSSDHDDMFFDQELWIGLLAVTFDYLGFDKIVVNEGKSNERILYTQNISLATDGEFSELLENIKISIALAHY